MNIYKLHPFIRERAVKFITQARLHGVDLRIICGTRTFEEQEKLFNQEKDGKDNDGNGIVDDRKEHVTNARAGESFHNYGLAIDVIPFVDGKPDWNTKLWPIISQLGKSLGFSWGGDWKKFKDLPHFEYPPGYTYKDLLQLKKDKKVDSEGFVVLPKNLSR